MLASVQSAARQVARRNLSSSIFKQPATRSSYTHNRCTSQPFSIAAATAAASLVVANTGPAECAEESGGMGTCGKICAGLLIPGIYFGMSLYQARGLRGPSREEVQEYVEEVIQKTPITEEELKEVHQFFLDTVTARYKAKGLNPSAEQLQKDASSDDYIIFKVREVFAQVAVDGFITKNLSKNLNPQEKRIADIFWRSMDIDDDQKISCQEFLITFTTQGAGSYKEVALPAKLTSTFRALDDDVDGSISKAEMECWVRWNLAQGAAAGANATDDFLFTHKETLGQLAKARQLERLTSEFGNGKYGKLPTHKEAADAYDGLLTKATVDITQELFAKYDVNKDGALQLDEFIQIAQGELALVVISNMPDYTF